MMRKFSLSALVAVGMLVGGLSAGSASAADLGGNCCADLEERIAELEATTARKGNRKVSLTISGWVAEQVMWWDDGAEQNVYVVGLGSTLATNVKFTGQATIAPGWTAGYVLHLEAIDSDSLTTNQFLPMGPNAVAGGFQTMTVLQSFWFMKSDHLGKVGVGKQSSASDNAAILVDGSGSLVPANWVMFDYNGFILRSKTAGILTSAAGVALNWQQFGGYCQVGGGAGGDCFGVPQQAVRYDSPTFAGFSVSAAWGGDDFWDVAARYSGEYNGFKLAAAAAYSDYSGNFWFGNGQQYSAVVGLPIAANDDGKWMKYFQVGAYIEHVPTGLWAYGAYGHLQTDGLTNPSAALATITGTAVLNASAAGGLAVPDGDTWYAKAGLRERWHPLGHTVLYGEFARYDDSVTDQFINNGYSATTQLWGLGVVQEIDAAAMSLWLSYRHLDAQLHCGNDSAAFCGPGSGIVNFGDLESFQYIKFGGLINF
jgi:hypothetical protein